MRALVLGASGFLGGHVRLGLVAAGRDVVTAGRTPLPGVHLPVDLGRCPPGAVLDVVHAAAPDVVVNAAGSLASAPDELAALNVTVPATLVEALRRGAPDARLVHLGSAAEYGRTPEGSSTAEDHPARPVGAYGLSKLAGTEIVRGARAAGLDAVVLRVTNPVGPGSPVANVAGNLASRLCDAGDRGEIRLGPGEAWRDFVDARDVADAVLAAAVAEGPLPAVVNIGTGRARRVQELMDILLKVSGHAGAVTHDGDGSARSAAVPWQQADVTLARHALGWTPRRDLLLSLTDLWESR